MQMESRQRTPATLPPQHYRIGFGMANSFSTQELNACTVRFRTRRRGVFQLPNDLISKGHSDLISNWTMV